MQIKRLTVLRTALIVLLALTGCPSDPPSGTPTLPDGAPRLILFLVLDQAPAETFVRFRPLLQHGLGRLLDESVVFTDAHHDHALTHTAPGHATLATGRHPASHGIVSNYWFDRRRRAEVYSVLDDADEHTPQRLAATTFGDWLKAASPASKVFAASGKDRAAILTAGHDADAAFWFDWDNGRFVTASYFDYGKPPWWADFHRDQHCDRRFGEVWEALPEVAQHSTAYGLRPLDEGLVQSRFPRPLGGVQLAPGEGFYDSLFNSPFIDEYLGHFVQALIEGEGLGKDDVPDFLGVSFSALDSVGHDFGPDSPEVLDTLLRLDRVLGELLDFIDRKIGLEHVIVSLSADHGITPLPELLRLQGTAARRLGGEDIACVQQVHRKLREDFGDEDWFFAGFYLDRELAEEKGVEPEAIEKAVRRYLEPCPGVVRVWTRTELVHGAPADEDDLFARLYRHNLHPERSPDIFVQFEPHTLTSRSSATNHGSPYPYDTGVPWLLRLPEARHLRIDERVHTVDVAPTLAALMGLDPATEVDGVDRGALLREP